MTLQFLQYSGSAISPVLYAFYPLNPCQNDVAIFSIFRQRHLTRALCILSAQPCQNGVAIFAMFSQRHLTRVLCILSAPPPGKMTLQFLQYSGSAISPVPNAFYPLNPAKMTLQFFQYSGSTISKVFYAFYPLNLCQNDVAIFPNWSNNIFCGDQRDVEYGFWFYGFGWGGRGEGGGAKCQETFYSFIMSANCYFYIKRFLYMKLVAPMSVSCRKFNMQGQHHKNITWNSWHFCLCCEGSLICKKTASKEYHKDGSDT